MKITILLVAVYVIVSSIPIFARQADAGPQRNVLPGRSGSKQLVESNASTRMTARQPASAAPGVAPSSSREGKMSGISNTRKNVHLHSGTQLVIGMFAAANG